MKNAVCCWKAGKQRFVVIPATSKTYQSLTAAIILFAQFRNA